MVDFEPARRPAPDGMYERLIQQMEGWIKETHLTDPANGERYSVDHKCLRNVRVAWQKIGGKPSTGDPGFAGTAAQAAQIVKKRGKMEKGKAPRGAVMWWSASPNNEAGHVAIADGRGNSVNNWASNIIKRTPLSQQQNYYLGWSSPAALGGGKGVDGKDDINTDAPSYGGDEASADSDQATSKIYFAGDYTRVKEAFSVANLRDAWFNPPRLKWSLGPSNRDGEMAQRMLAQLETNKPGFIVRDPMFAGELAQQEQQQKKKKKKNAIKEQADPDAGGAAQAIGSDWLSFTENYGFRFLYNPTTFSEGYTSISDSDPLQYMHDVSSGAQAIVGASGGTLNLNLMLYRKLDVELLRHFYRNGTISEIDIASLYGEVVKPETLRALSEQGTMLDLEYLFRTCNGSPQDTWHGMSSDWGMLMPTMVVISLGDGPSSRRIRGMLTGVNFSHSLFVAGMIPVYTEVQLTINRVVDQYYQAYSEDGNAPDADTIISSPKDREEASA